MAQDLEIVSPAFIGLGHCHAELIIHDYLRLPSELQIVDAIGVSACSGTCDNCRSTLAGLYQHDGENLHPLVVNWSGNEQRVSRRR